MNYSKLFFVFLLSLFAHSGFAQSPTIATGKVIDKTTRKGIDYANIRFKGTVGAIGSNTAGNFKISSVLRPKTLVVSLIGYQTVEVPVTPGTINKLSIELSAIDVNLKEVVVKPKKRKQKREIDTAALFIFHAVQRNREFNRAEANDSFHFKEYSKMIYSVLNPTDKFLNANFFKPYKFFFEKPDSTPLGRRYFPLFVQEQLKEVYFRKKPQRRVNLFRYNRMSGLPDPLWVKLIGYHFDVTDAYESVHIVLEKSFISPFSFGAEGVYNYHVMDTTHPNGRTTYKLNFVGRVKEDLCEKGYALIDSATWGIKFISYKPNEKANLNYIYDLTLEQTFNLVDSTHWMLTNEDMLLEGNLLKNPNKLAIRIEKKTTRSDISLHQTAPDSIWASKDDIVDGDVYKKNRAYIDTMRLDTLSTAERLVYKHFDSVQHVPAFKAFKFFTNLLTTSNVKCGPVDFGRLYHIASRNNVEGWRLRLGIYTNRQISDKFFTGGYVAYGTKDHAIKYVANLRFLLPSRYQRWHAIEAEYINDMFILGNEDSYASYDNVLTLISGATLSKVMKTRQINFYYERDWIKGLSTKLVLSNKTFYSIPSAFSFSRTDNAGITRNIPQITTTEISGEIRYCKTDYYFESYTYRYPLQTRTPSITLKFAFGFENKLFGGNYTYQKLMLQFKHRWQLPVIGYSKIFARAGYIFGNSPYPVSNISSSNLSFVRDDLTLQVAAPFEFVSDKFIMLWWEHYFDGFFLNRIPGISKLHMREFIQCKALFGGYSSKNASLITLPSDIRVPGPIPYVEVGVGLENILNLFQLGFYWRCTYRDNPNAANFAVKLGIYPGF